MLKKITLSLTFAASCLFAGETYTMQSIEGNTYTFEITDSNEVVLKTNNSPSYQEVVLEFFGTRCGPCKAMAPSLNEKYQNGEVKVIALETQYSSPEAISKFKNETGVSYPIIATEERTPQVFLNELYNRGIFKGYVPFVINLKEL